MASSKLEPERPEYNILLLGESGAGKTLFINSFINYVDHETLADAIKSPVSVVIRVQLTITDDNDDVHVIDKGEDDGNEHLENLAHSCTNKCRSYLIDFGAFRVRLIDSPGVGSTVIETTTNENKFDKHSEGVEQDEKYVDDVLEFIGHFKHLHAIAIVVKSNETRYTTRFELCLKQLLSSFNKSAINNVFFILTFGESTRFKTDIVKHPLITLLEKATQATESTQSISDKLLSKNKVYSVDNKGFRYFLAVIQGAWFKDFERIVSDNAWTQSRDECKRLIDYITGQGGQPVLNPHRVSDTLSINEARKFINNVENLMMEILSVITKNEQSLNKCLTASSKEDEQIVEYENRLNEKHEDIEIIKVPLPKTTCTSSKCVKVYTVDGEEKTHYSQICCDGCIVTIMRRLFCTAIELRSGNCKMCGCHVRDHQRIYYTTQIVTRDIKDKDVILKEMRSATDYKQKIEIGKKFIQLQIQQFDNEKMVIENAQTLFTNFLKTNPIFPRERGNGSVAEVISPDEVFAIRDQLLNLEKFGPAIKRAYGIAQQGEKDDWLASKLNMTKEKLIKVKNTFSKGYQRQPDSRESEVRPGPAIAPIILNDNFACNQ